jgi:hypothetical protein
MKKAYFDTRWLVRCQEGKGLMLRTEYLPKVERPNTLSRLLLLTVALCGLWTPRANGQQPAPDARQPGNIAPSTPPAKIARQVPLLLELTDTVTQEAKPGVPIHFLVLEDVVDDGFVVVAKGTGVTATVERVDKHAGPDRGPAAILRFGAVRSQAGEDLPIDGPTAKQRREQKLAMDGFDMPGIRGLIFARSVQHAGPGTRHMVALTLPPDLARLRLPAAKSPPGYGTVYFFSSHLWCGAVAIDRNSKVLLRPGRYSCRMERFSPQETYLEFDVAAGGTYFVVEDTDSAGRSPGNLSLGSTAEVVDKWNTAFFSRRASVAADLTQADPEVFRKLPPFVCPGSCAAGNSARAVDILWPSDAVRQSMPDLRDIPAPVSQPSSPAETAGSSATQTTPLVLELGQEVTSRRAKTGDEVRFHVVDDVIADGLVIVAKGTEVKGKVERVDKRGGWMKEGGVSLSLRPATSVTGEELPIAGTLGQSGGKRNVKEGLAVGLHPEIGGPIALPFMPFVRGDDYVLPSNTRYGFEVTMPPKVDRTRIRAAQPSRQPPGYATVFVLVPVWCGAVRIDALGKTLFRPGNYSCRVEKFSPAESYVDFDFSDGGTYYLVGDSQPSSTDAAGAIGTWNIWVQRHPSGTTADLTKIDAEAFRKLPPFINIGRF